MSRCWCGEEKGQNIQRPYYEVTGEGVTQPSGKHMDLIQCDSCGTIRQAGFSYTNAQEQEKFYKDYPPTLGAYAAKDYEHDRKIAGLRCDDYGLRRGEKVFDVGSGSGAFVDEARARGAIATGCEIAVYANAKNQDYIYQKRLEDVLLPTDSQDRVTCHDVLEHAFDPPVMLKEIHRATKQGGSVVVEIPRAHVEAGVHHWKQEHLWYWTDQQFSDMVSKAGFHIVAAVHPIESKTRIYATKLTENRPQILLPPGIGDSFWSMTKLEAFIKAKGLALPDLQVVCDKDMRHNGHQRAFPFLEMFPFSHASWKSHNSGVSPESRALWREAYSDQGRTIFENVLGCDYFLSYNGWLRVGAEMDDCDPGLKTDWASPMHVSLEQERFRKECQEKYGPYIAFYFVFQGTYQHWTKDFPLGAVVDYINVLCAKRKVRPVLVGAGWDAEEQNLLWVSQRVKNCVSLLGQTSVEQAFGLMRGAECVVGYPSGLSIMAAVLGCKTLIIWNDYYNKDFFWRACPPETRGRSYHIATTRGMTSAALVSMTERLLDGGDQPVRLANVPVNNTKYHEQKAIVNMGKPVNPSAKKQAIQRRNTAQGQPALEPIPAHNLSHPPYEHKVEGCEEIKYSILLPYHGGAVELKKTMQQFTQIYQGRKDFEVIIIEDIKRGNPDQTLYADLKSVEWPYPIRVVRYVHPTNFNDSVFYNAGASVASGKLLVLSKAECYHKTNILAGLDDEFAQNPTHSYIACAVEEVDKKFISGGWYQHSTHAPRRLQYCSAIAKITFDLMGGYDEQYAEGHCFEDDDFLETVISKGVSVIQRDDLVAQYQKRVRNYVPHITSLHSRNEAIYCKKWNKRAK